jgi:hypothetical protein
VSRTLRSTYPGQSRNDVALNRRCARLLAPRSAPLSRIEAQDLERAVAPATLDWVHRLSSGTRSCSQRCPTSRRRPSRCDRPHIFRRARHARTTPYPHR